MRTFQLICSCFIGVTTAIAPARAQSTQAVLAGQLVNSVTTLAVPSAQIECISQESRQKVDVTSDAFGFYAIASLSPGTYAITVTKDGFQSQQARAVEVAVASRVELNFRLRPISDLWEAGRFGSWRMPDSQQTFGFYGPDVDTSRIAVFTANIAASSPLETSRSDVVGRTAIDDLPLTGRDVYTMLLLLPGVTSDTGTARGLGISTFGQRPSSSNYLLDGADNNFLLTTGPLNSAAPEFIEEYRVSSGNFSAEYGRTSGFVANAITRAATGAWHGAAFFYLENEHLNANGFQENAAGIARNPATLTEGGITAGGPLVAQRLFLAGGFNRARTDALADPQLYALPTASFIQAHSAAGYGAALLREFPLPEAPAGAADAALVSIAPNADFYRSDSYARLDYQPSASNRLFAHFLRDGLNQPQFLFSPWPGFSTPYLQASLSVAGAWTRQINASFLNELRASRTGDSIRFVAPNSGVPQFAVYSDSDIAQNGKLYPVTFPGPPNSYNYRNRGGAWEAADTFTGVQGRHIWKVGGSIFQRSASLDLAFVPGGYLLFQNLSDFVSGPPQELVTETDKNSPGFDLVQPTREYRYRQANAFAQDSFRIHRLTFDFGFRYEWYGTPANTGSTKDTLILMGSGPTIQTELAGAFAPTTTSQQNQPLYKAAGLNLAPRAGLAWDIPGSGGAILRASYGMFYDRPFDNLWEAAIQNRYQTAAFLNFASPLPPGASTAAIEAAGEYSHASQIVNGLVFQPGLRAPRVQNGFIGLQRPFHGWLSLEADALTSRGRALVTTDIVNRQFSVTQAPNNLLGYINPSLNSLDYRANQGKSQYSALSGTLKIHSRVLFAQASYTWSHSMDNQSEPLANTFFDLNQFSSRQNPSPFLSAFTTQFASNQDWANSDFDQRHNLVFYFVWRTPSASRKALRGWKLSGLAAARSGVPFSIYANQRVGLLVDPIVNERADLLNPSQAMISTPGPGGRYLLNAAAFAAPAAALGNTGRNAFTGPGLFSADASLSRIFRLPRLRENTNLTVRADAYNVLNHANLNTPDSSWYPGSPTFGLSAKGRTENASGFPLLTPLKESARIIQISLRLEF